MKKLLFIAAISLGVVVSANAQDTKIGAKAGINLANMTGDDVEDADMLIGFQVGGYVHLGLSDAFAIQPELLFEMKGASYDAGDDESVSTNLSYISIPILAKYMITEELDVHLGPQIGLLMSAETDGEDVSDFYKSTDFGLAVGAGYELESGLNFSLRYAMSLSTIGEDFEESFVNPLTGETETMTFEAGDIKNSVITIAVGYSF
ncbi:MAG: porin family protein [Vicingaceae bacterium]